MSFWAYLRRNWDDMLLLARDHAVIVAVAIAIATVLGIGLGVLTYRKRAARDLVLRITGVFLTIPSLALYALLITVPFLGMGAKPVVVALTLYALLPIVCNTVTGLLGVDAAIVESAQGMGMGQWQRLARIELPLAWPVIMTGIRVSTLLDALTEDLTEGLGVRSYRQRHPEASLRSAEECCYHRVLLDVFDDPERVLANIGRWAGRQD